MMQQDHEPKQTVYQITISGTLDPARSVWFDGLEVQYQEGITVLTGRLEDPQALYGVIERIRDLGLTLIEVRRSAKE